MSNLAKQVEDWYHKNTERMAAKFKRAEFIKKDWDPQRGGVTIEIEAENLVATIGFWFKGDVSALVLKGGSDEPIVLDDRVLVPGEEVSSLLDTYLTKLESLV